MKFKSMLTGFSKDEECYICQESLAAIMFLVAFLNKCGRVLF